MIISGANYMDAVQKYGINTNQVTFYKELWMDDILKDLDAQFEQMLDSLDEHEVNERQEVRSNLY